MPSERGVRYSHVALFTLTLLASIVALAISASLVKYYNDNGYPAAHYAAYRDRIRILLVASVWTTAISRECLGTVACYFAVLGTLFPA